MLRPLRRSTDRSGRRLRRGVCLLPSMFTIGNMFCGYACIVHAMRGEFHIAAPFIGFAMVLDMLDGRIARMTGTASDFGIELNSLADVISFGMAPAILSFAWGLQPLGRLGWAVGFLFVAAAALRLARFNIQAGSVDKRYFVGMPSPAAAAGPSADGAGCVGQGVLRWDAESGGGGGPCRDGVCLSRRLHDLHAGSAGHRDGPRTS